MKDRDRDYDKQCRLYGLLLHAIEGDLSDKQIQELNDLIVSDPDTAKHYLEFMNLYSELSPYGDIGYINLSTCGSEAQKYDLFLQSLANQEQISPRIETKKTSTESEIELVQKVTYGDTKFFTLKKTSVVSLILSAAALILLVLFARFAPQKHGIPVATLIDSLDAKWSGKDDQLQNGDQIVTSTEAYILQAGYAQLRFTNDTLVAFEGPAEFQILTDDQIKLNYGKLYSIVPKQAFGFMVSTPRAKIVDLGTEFGVYQGRSGDTELHVIKGCANLISGGQVDNVNMPVTQGDAKRITALTGNVENIACDTTLFVRKIYSQQKCVWRGQTAINLADIIGGGNGFGTGKINKGIEVATGKMIPDLLSDQIKVGPAGYREVKENRFIDGVFVPGREEGTTAIASDNSISVKFPKTSGNYWGGIFNGAFHQGDKVSRHTLKLNSTVFGDLTNPAISIHSNQGITLDLFEIRKNIPEAGITQFRSLVGISETVKDYVDEAMTLDAQTLSQRTFSTAVFWVFLDGKKVYESEMSNTDKPVQLEIPIHTNDRFLTLAVTEGGDAWGYDWALLGRPELVLEFSEP